MDLAPVPARVVSSVLRGLPNWGSTEFAGAPGQIIFVAGQRGSGRSSVLDAIASEVATRRSVARVVHGRFSDGEYQPARRHERLSPDALALIESVAKIGVSAIGGFAAHLVSVTGPARRGIERLTTATTPGETEELTVKLLRSEASRQPVVCVLDDLDQAPTQWFDALLVSLAREVHDELPLVFVASLLGPEDPDTPIEDFASAWHVALDLRRHDLAEWHGVRALKDAELESWLGSMEPGLLESISYLSEGRAGIAADAWNAWRAAKLVELAPDRRWRATRGARPLLAEAADDCAGRIRGAIGNAPVDLRAVVDALAMGAVQGEVFVAEAVAHATTYTWEPRRSPWDPDALIDTLDDFLSDGDDSLLIDLGPQTVVLTDGRVTRLSRYQFRRRADWHALRYAAIRTGDRGDIAVRLALATNELYPHTPATISEIVALLLEGGHLREANKICSGARIARSIEAAHAEARLLQRMDPGGWTASEYRWAAKTMFRCCDKLRERIPDEDLRDYAHRAWHFARESGADPERAECLWLVTEVGQLSVRDNERFVERVLKLCQQGRGTRSAHAAALAQRAAIEYARGQHDDALATLRTAVDMKVENREPDGAAQLYFQLAVWHADRDESAQLIRAGIELAIDPAARSAGLFHLACRTREPDAQRDLFSEALEIAEEHGLLGLEPFYRAMLAAVEMRAGNATAAEGHFTRLQQLEHSRHGEARLTNLPSVLLQAIEQEDEQELWRVLEAHWPGIKAASHAHEP